ncbi:MAG: CinA family protein [Dehalococcoidia bacterium]|nr:MAG: CinA family protein [Dehalococcoidia bacterium]
MGSIGQEIGCLLIKKGLTLGVVESATGGLISHLITDVPGSSDYFKGSITAYSNHLKINLVGVNGQIIRKYGAVSPQVVGEMAEGGKRVLNVDICLADSGIAGPSGTTQVKSVGLFYIGLSSATGTSSRKYRFGGNRKQNKQAAAEAALSWLREYLLDLDMQKG